jgi:hypothetical protein
MMIATFGYKQKLLKKRKEKNTTKICYQNAIAPLAASKHI